MPDKLKHLDVATGMRMYYTRETRNEIEKFLNDYVATRVVPLRLRPGQAVSGFYLLDSWPTQIIPPGRVEPPVDPDWHPKNPDWRDDFFAALGNQP